LRPGGKGFLATKARRLKGTQSNSNNI